jgi:hypothetical protein
MFLDTKTVKSNLGCELVDVPAMLPLRAPTIVPPRAPTIVPLRLVRAPTIVPPRTVEETLIVRTAIQRVDFKRLISFSLSVKSSWRKSHPMVSPLAESFEVPVPFSTLVPEGQSHVFTRKALSLEDLRLPREFDCVAYETKRTDYQLHSPFRDPSTVEKLRHKHKQCRRKFLLKTLVYACSNGYLLSK